MLPNYDSERKFTVRREQVQDDDLLRDSEQDLKSQNVGKSEVDENEVQKEYTLIQLPQILNGLLNESLNEP